jgi:hypothetical protein
MICGMKFFITLKGQDEHSPKCFHNWFADAIGSGSAIPACFTGDRLDEARVVLVKIITKESWKE